MSGWFLKKEVEKEVEKVGAENLKRKKLRKVMKEENNEERRGRKRDLEKKEYKRLSMRRKSGRV